MNEFIYSILEWIHGWVGSWGWAIVVFTIMIRLVLTPLDFKSRKSMRKTQKLQPQLAALQKKYANDREKLNTKTAELYKKEHVNPLSSCLPMLLTWPILIAVFGAMRLAANQGLLQQLAQLLDNKQPVLESWLWVKNLWMPDSPFAAMYPDMNTLRTIPADQWAKWLAGLNESGLPALIGNLGLTADSFGSNTLANTLQQLIGTVQQQGVIFGNASYLEAARNITEIPILVTKLELKNGYNGLMLLPILSAVTQIVMTKITGMNQQTPGNEQAPGAGAGKMMQWFFPIFSLVICFSYSAAFALYWVAGNLVSMGQTVVINKILDSKEKAAAIAAGEGTMK